MAKKEFKKQNAQQSEQQNVRPMSLKESKAYRASLHRPKAKELSEAARQHQFKLFWTQNRKKYGKPKDLEPILWIHLKATGNDQPDKFEDGMAHFGLKKN